MTTLSFLIYFSSISFLFFGISCFVTSHMKTEFNRYGLSKKRKLVGLLQVLGGLGILIGYFVSPPLALFSAIGLTILMLLGFGVRIKIKDTAIQASPSLIYAILNGFISFKIYELFF